MNQTFFIPSVMGEPDHTGCGEISPLLRREMTNFTLPSEPVHPATKIEAVHGHVIDTYVTMAFDGNEVQEMGQPIREPMAWIESLFGRPAPCHSGFGEFGDPHIGQAAVFSVLPAMVHPTPEFEIVTSDIPSVACCK